MRRNLTPFTRGARALEQRLNAHLYRVDSGMNEAQDYAMQNFLEKQIKFLKSEIETTRKQEFSVDDKILQVIWKMEQGVKKTFEILYLLVPPELNLGL